MATKKEHAIAPSLDECTRSLAILSIVNSFAAPPALYAVLVTEAEQSTKRNVSKWT